MLPTQLIDSQVSKANADLIAKDNIEMIPSTSVAKALRREGLAHEQLDSDEIKSLLKLAEKKSYIRSLQIAPFRLIMMSQEQCNVMHKLFLSMGPLDLFMDATGQKNTSIW